MDEQRTIFQIPAENLSKFEEQIAKLSKKSLKLIGEAISPVIFGYEEKELADGHTHRIYEVLLTAAAPKMDGWEFVARLDHSNETGTIIRMVPNTIAALPEQFRLAKNTHCDHCNVTRYRRDTFVVRNEETGEFKQVGSTCLTDFFGHDPAKIAKLAEILGYAYECGRGGEQFVGGDLRYIHLQTYLEHVAAMVRRNGWVSGGAAYQNENLVSTRTRASQNMFDVEYQVEITADDVQLALEAIEWAQSLSQKEYLSDYEHNVQVIANATMIEPRSLGIAASIVGVYFKNKVANMPKTIEVGNFENVIQLFKTAGANLKFPKIRLALETGEPIVLSVAGAKAAQPGTVNVKDGGPYGNNIWYGRVSPNGTWQNNKGIGQTTMSSLTALLTALATNPAATAAKYGKLTGQCCFCSRPLNDARSTAVGYGPVCAKNYSLPWN